MNPSVVLASALLAAAAPAVADWPQWGGPERDFTVADYGLADSWPEEGPTELWRRPLGDGYSGISEDGGQLFTMYRDGDRDAVISLDAATGETLWVGKGLGSQVGNVVRFGDHLYGTRGSSASTYLTAVRATTGETAWRDRAIGDCTLLRVGDRALLLESDGRLHLAKLAATGLEIISTDGVLDGRSWTAPTLAGTRLYLRDRKEVVALELGAAALSRPAVSN